MVCSVIESNRLRCVKTIGVFDYVEILFHSKSELAHGGRERERGEGSIKSGCVKQLASLGILKFCFAVNELEF